MPKRTNEDERSEKINQIRAMGEKYMRELKIHESGKGDKKKYFIRPTLNGKTLYISFKSKEEAEELLSILPKRTSSSNKKTFAHYFYEMIDSIQISNTRISYFYTATHLRSFFDKPLSEISKDALNKIFLNSTPATCQHLNAVLGKIGKLSKEQVFNNTLIDLDAKRRFPYRGKSRKVHNPEAILNAIMNCSYKDYPKRELAQIAFLIMCYTGIRIGELCSITNADIGANVLTVSKTLTYNFTINKLSASRAIALQGHPKGKEEREVPLMPSVVDLFDRYFALLKILGLNKRKIIPREKISGPLKTISKDIGHHITPHVARHIFGTIFGKQCKSIGEALKLQQLLGHKHLTTTQRYITIAKPTVEDIASKLPELNFNKNEITNEDEK